MQLTQQTDYALRTLLFLALAGEDKLSTLTEIAEKFNMARNHLTKIVGKLAKLDYLFAVRGNGGGIKINSKALDVSIYEIIQHFEPTFKVIDCNGLVCPIRNGCRLNLILDEASQAFIKVLQSYTVRDMLPKTQQEYKKVFQNLQILAPKVQTI